MKRFLDWMSVNPLISKTRQLLSKGPVRVLLELGALFSLFGFFAFGIYKFNEHSVEYLVKDFVNECLEQPTELLFVKQRWQTQQIKKPFSLDNIDRYLEAECGCLGREIYELNLSERSFNTYFETNKGIALLEKCQDVGKKYIETGALKDEYQSRTSLKTVELENGEIAIAIVGTIDFGLNDELLRLINKEKGRISKVIIYSTGGMADEALRLGITIREHGLGTIGPTGTPEEPKCEHIPDVNPLYCTCASACFIVFAGGVKRESRVLGVHRAKHSKRYLVSVDNMKGITEDVFVNENLYGYILATQIPEAIGYKWLTTPNSDIYYLNEQEVGSISGYLPEIEDQFKEFCPDKLPRKSFERFPASFDSSRSPFGALGKKLRSAIRNLLGAGSEKSQCEIEFDRHLALKAFNSTRP